MSAESNPYILIDTCRKGNLEHIQSLMFQLTNINVNHLFIDACKFGHFEVAQFLFSMSQDF